MKIKLKVSMGGYPAGAILSATPIEMGAVRIKGKKGKQSYALPDEFEFIGRNKKK